MHRLSFVGPEAAQASSLDLSQSLLKHTPSSPPSPVTSGVAMATHRVRGTEPGAAPG